MSVRRKPVVRKKKRWGKVVEFTPIERSLQADDKVRSKIIDEARKAKVITPQALADRHGIRVSTAGRLLKELEAEGSIELVGSSSRVKVYTGKS